MCISFRLKQVYIFTFWYGRLPRLLLRSASGSKRVTQNTPQSGFRNSSRRKSRTSSRARNRTERARCRSRVAPRGATLRRSGCDLQSLSSGSSKDEYALSETCSMLRFHCFSATFEIGKCYARVYARNRLTCTQSSHYIVPSLVSFLNSGVCRRALSRRHFDGSKRFLSVCKLFQWCVFREDRLWYSQTRGLTNFAEQWALISQITVQSQSLLLAGLVSPFVFRMNVWSVNTNLPGISESLLVLN